MRIYGRFVANEDLTCWELIRYDTGAQIVMHIKSLGAAYSMRTITPNSPRFTDIVNQLSRRFEVVIDGQLTMLNSNLELSQLLYDRTTNPVLLWAVKHRIIRESFEDRLDVVHIRNKWASPALHRLLSK